MIRVVVIDDSTYMREVLGKIIDSDPRTTVVAKAANAYEARALVKQHNPDVLTLDIDMPGMNGLSFLRNLMRLRPMPVVMISSFTAKGAAPTLSALEMGAFDVVEKPRGDVAAITEQAGEIVDKLVCAAHGNINALSGEESNSPSLRFEIRWTVSPGWA